MLRYLYNFQTLAKMCVAAKYIYTSMGVEGKKEF